MFGHSTVARKAKQKARKSQLHQNRKHEPGHRSLTTGSLDPHASLTHFPHNRHSPQPTASSPLTKQLRRFQRTKQTPSFRPSNLPTTLSAPHSSAISSPPATSPLVAYYQQSTSPSSQFSFKSPTSPSFTSHPSFLRKPSPPHHISPSKLHSSSLLRKSTPKTTIKSISSAPQLAQPSTPASTQTQNIFPQSQTLSTTLHQRISEALPLVRTAVREYTTAKLKQTPSLTSPPHHASTASLSTRPRSSAQPRSTKTNSNPRKPQSRHNSTSSSTPPPYSSSASQSSSQSSSPDQQHHNQQEHQRPPKLSPFQRLLPKINNLSILLKPKVKKLSFYVKSGLIQLTKPFLTPLKSTAQLISHPLSTLASKIGDKLEGLLDLVDRQIAKRGDVPKDQITAIRTQIVAIAANAIVALSKAVAAYVSNSGVMLAEALHSLADLSNQALLLFGTTKALRDSDDVHPYGYVTAKYIYGVLSASGVFFISCALTIYHAVAQFFDESHAVEVTSLTVIVLGVSLLVEGYSQYAAVKSIKELADRDKMSFFQYIRHGKETASIAVFVEDSIAIVGLMIAIATTALTHFYQDNLFDTVGTLAIGLAMGFVSYFLFHKNESYVMGTSFNAEEKSSLLSALKTRDAVIAVHDLKAVHYGEGDIRVKAEVVFDGTIIARQVLDESKLVPVAVPISDPTEDGKTSTQHMIIGPDGTLAGHQLLYHLTSNSTPLSRDEAQALLLRFGGECVVEVARETDQVEKHTRSLHPGITHMDLECHSSNPNDDFSSESFLYPYLNKFRDNLEKEQQQQELERIAQKKRARKSRAWTAAAKTSFFSLTQAMKGEHEQYQQQQQFLHPSNLPPSTPHHDPSKHHGTVDISAISHPTTPSSPSSPTPHNTTSSQHHSTPSPQSPNSSPTPTYQHATTDLLLTKIQLPNLDQHTIPPYSALQGISAITRTNGLHRGRYIKPVHAKELVENEVYNDILNTYKQTMGDIDFSMTLFPIDSHQHAVLFGKQLPEGNLSSTEQPSVKA